MPCSWYTEIANGLGMAERRGRLSPTGLQEAISLLNRLRLALDALLPRHAFGSVLNLIHDLD
jgi:hypothetical protein